SVRRQTRRLEDEVQGRRGDAWSRDRSARDRSARDVSADQRPGAEPDCGARVWGRSRPARGHLAERARWIGDDEHGGVTGRGAALERGVTEALEHASGLVNLEANVLVVAERRQRHRDLDAIAAREPHGLAGVGGALPAGGPRPHEVAVAERDDLDDARLAEI